MLIVTGGENESGNVTKVELLKTDGSHICHLEELPAPRYHHTQSGNITCGGGDASSQSSCVMLRDGSWERTHTLSKERNMHSSWNSPVGVLLLGGKGAATSTELLLKSGGTSAPFNLKHPTRYTWLMIVIVFNELISMLFQSCLCHRGVGGGDYYWGTRGRR